MINMEGLNFELLQVLSNFAIGREDRLQNSFTRSYCKT